MSGIVIRVAGCIACTVLFTATAVAQRDVGSTSGAPVPGQVLNARAVFVGNGGSESYGAESYFRLTKYDGGPNRAYNSFYNALEGWGHYELVSSTRDADVSFVIRFANPVVDRTPGSGTDRGPEYWVYDPQLDLSINDPRTGLALWTITEHIEPGSNRTADNRHFDEAVTRLVGDLQRLILTPETAAVSQNVIPPGAVRLEVRRRRLAHAFIGGALGGAIGGYLGQRTPNYTCNESFTLPQPVVGPFFPNMPLPDPPPMPDLSCASRRAQAKMRNGFLGALSGAVVGGLVGWAVPVSF